MPQFALLSSATMRYHAAVSFKHMNVSWYSCCFAFVNISVSARFLAAPLLRQVCLPVCHYFVFVLRLWNGILIHPVLYRGFGFLWWYTAWNRHPNSASILRVTSLWGKFSAIFAFALVIVYARYAIGRRCRIYVWCFRVLSQHIFIITAITIAAVFGIYFAFALIQTLVRPSNLKLTWMILHIIKPDLKESSQSLSLTIEYAQIYN